MRSMILKYILLLLLILGLFVSVGRCQDDEDEDEDTYDEELAELESTTTRRPRRTRTTTVAPASARNDTLNDGNSTQKAATASEVATTARVATPIQVATQPARQPATTPISEYDDEDSATEEEGYGYIFRPLNNLVDNIVAGNITGIVDNALSIRTPPEIRQFVNNVMQNVFGVGVNGALKQFMPSLFSSETTPTTGRDPIPTQQPRRRITTAPEVPLRVAPEVSSPVAPPAVSTPSSPTVSPPVKMGQGSATVGARTNGTVETTTKAEVKQAKHKPMELAFVGHPGAPASRLRCEIIQ